MYFANFLGICTFTIVCWLVLVTVIWYLLGVAFPGMFDFYQTMALFLLLIIVRGVCNAGDTTQS